MQSWGDMDYLFEQARECADQRRRQAILAVGPFPVPVQTVPGFLLDLRTCGLRTLATRTGKEGLAREQIHSSLPLALLPGRDRTDPDSLLLELPLSRLSSLPPAPARTKLVIQKDTGGQSRFSSGHLPVEATPDTPLAITDNPFYPQDNPLLLACFLTLRLLRPMNMIAYLFFCNTGTGIPSRRYLGLEQEAHPLPGL
jgi:hypothetical protein